MELLAYKASKRHLKKLAFENFIKIIKENNYEKEKILRQLSQEIRNNIKY